MTSFTDAVTELNQNTNELKTLLCSAAANQKKLKYACSQFESFNCKFRETHSTEGTLERNEMLALKGIIEQITRLKSIVAHNFSQQWAQNTISSSASSLASEICMIIKKSHDEAEKLDPENASIFDPSNPSWLKYHILDLRTIATSFNNFLSKRSTEDQVSTAIKARLKSINKFIEEYKNEDITPEGCVFSVIPIHYKSWKIEHSDFEKKELVGSGASARVYKGIMKATGKEVAIKQLKPKELKGGKFRSFQREISILAMVDHPTILKFYGATETFPYSIITEWMGGGDLYKALKTHSLTNTQLTICAFDIARGMAYLHENMIVHRDLKSLNILLDSNGFARICDLGFARVVEKTTHDSIKTFVGTYYWMAPELLEENPSYTPKVDVYSYGIMLWEMLTHKIPYDGQDPTTVIKNVFMKNSRSKMPADVLPGIQKLIEDCWERDPKLRPSFKNIVNTFATGEAYYADTNVDEVLQYARKVLAQDDPDSLTTRNLLDEDEKQPVTLAKFNETFEKISIPSWYFDPCWTLFQKFIPEDISNPSIDLNSLSKGLMTFMKTTKYMEAVEILVKFPENSIPREYVNELIELMPTGEDKLDEFICVIACKNSMAEEAILRAFPPIPSRATFNYLSNNADKIKLNYIDAISGRAIVSLTSKNDIQTANCALEYFVSIASHLNKQKASTSDEAEKKKIQGYLNKILSESNVQVIVKFAINISKNASSSRKSDSNDKTAISSSFTYFQQMAIDDIPFTKKSGIFDLAISYPANAEFLKTVLIPILESNEQTATNFIQWISVPENLQSLSFDTFVSLINAMKPHKTLYKDVKNVIGLAKGQMKGKSKDLKKLEQEFN